MKAKLLLLSFLIALNAFGQRECPVPLYTDPNFKGAADPEVIWNEHEQEWWMFYTSRRAVCENAPLPALAIGVADKLAMMEYSIFSVISPEGCAAILWNDPSKIEVATKAMKITPHDLKSANLIDDIIIEPSSGAHRDRDAAAKSIKDYFLSSLQEIRSNPDFTQRRYDKLMNYGSFK